MARNQCTTKRENMASYNTDYTVPDLIDFFEDDWEGDQTADWKKKYSYS